MCIFNQNMMLLATFWWLLASLLLFLVIFWGISLSFLWIYIKSPFVIVIVCCVFVRFLKGNNSALGGKRVLLKVANERYCNIVLIFCFFFVWAQVKKHQAKKCFFWVPTMFFWAPGCAWVCQPPTGARSEGPIGPQSF